MPGRRRFRKPSRRSPWREPKPRILCVCEGEATEPECLKSFKDWCRNPRVEVEVDNNHGVPLTLVKRAKVRKEQAESEAERVGDENLRFDQVWCVFDIDEHPHVPEAKDMARANGIDLAISNAAFELWLILHFRDSPGAQHRRHLVSILKKFIRDYDKRLDFSKVRDGYLDAVKRARRLDEDAIAMGEPGRDPTTGVWRLTESIRGQGDEEYLGGLKKEQGSAVARE
ncbi:MAG: RloB domain-containing protein [Deltaproteobacteria bacterium]|nr:RloB domain-containing protein [Deltaproteobacteria bacterium]